MSTSSATLGVFVGCGLNLVFLELIMKEDPGAGNLLTFVQFSFIAIDGFIFTSKFGTVKCIVGLKNYMMLVLLYFLSSTINNYAFNFNIPVPLHMIMKSGSLIANMIMGIAIMNKKYSVDKYVAVLMITIGIVICTIMSSKEVKSTVPNTPGSVSISSLDDLFWWFIGIALLTVALFISARMGLYQESLAVRFGKHPKEQMFYLHLLPLPFFMLLAPNLWEHAKIAVNSPAFILPTAGLAIPRIIAYFIGNVLTQYLCTRSVFTLTTECASLTVTLILTLRKFMSLIVSIIYFKNPFTIYHWIGTILVFGGTFMFAEVVPKIRKSLQSKSRSKQKTN